MKGRLASKKLEIRSLAVEADRGGQVRVRLHRPVEAAAKTIILGDGADAAAAVVDVLEELGVL